MFWLRRGLWLWLHETANFGNSNRADPAPNGGKCVQAVHVLRASLNHVAGGGQNETDPAKTQDDSEVFRFGGFGTILLLSLLALIGLYPLLLGGIAGRLAGGLILAVILVSSAAAAEPEGAYLLADWFNSALPR